MGTKNRLVIFIIDPMQNHSESEVIKITVIHHGEKGISAEAAFAGSDTEQ